MKALLAKQKKSNSSIYFVKSACCKESNLV